MHIIARFCVRQKVRQKIRAFRARRGAFAVFDVFAQPVQNPALCLRVIQMRVFRMFIFSENGGHQRPRIVRHIQKMRIDEAIVMAFIRQICLQGFVRSVALPICERAGKRGVAADQIFSGG